MVISKYKSLKAVSRAFELIALDCSVVFVFELIVGFTGFQVVEDLVAVAVRPVGAGEVDGGVETVVLVTVKVPEALLPA